MAMYSLISCWCAIKNLHNSRLWLLLLY